MEPVYLPAYYNRGIAYNHLNKFQSALDDYTQVMDLEVNKAKAYYKRAKIFQQQAKWTEAFEDAKQAQQLGHPEANALIKDIEQNQRDEK